MGEMRFCDHKVRNFKTITKNKIKIYSEEEETLLMLEYLFIIKKTTCGSNKIKNFKNLFQ